MLFLVALLPAVVVGPIFVHWRDASLIGRILIGGAATWAVAVLTAGLLAIVRILIRISKEQRSERDR
jgi:hypothetical protein